MNIRNSKYLVRLLVFSLIIGTIPVLTLGIFSYFRTYATIQKKAVAANGQILEQTELRVEQILLGIDNAVTQFINTPGVNAALHQKLGAAEFEQIDDLSRGLYSLQTFQYGIQDIFLANMEQDWVIYNRGITRFRDWETSRSWVPFLEDERTSFWLSHVDVSVPPEKDMASIPPGSVFLMKKLPIQAVSPIGFVLAVIPGYEVQKYLLRSSSLGNVTILDANHRLLATQDEDHSEQAFSAVKQALDAQTAESGSFRSSFGKEPVLVTFRKSSYNGWVFLSVSPMEELKRESRAIGVFTAATCLGILLLTYILSWFGTMRMYSPIRSLVLAVTGGDGAAGDSGDDNEFERIGDRVRNLRAVHSQMKDQLHGQNRKLMDFFVVKLLQGEVKPRELAAQAEKYNLPLHWRRISVLVVDIASLEHTRYGEEDRDLLMFAVNNIAGELWEPEQRLHPVLINPLQVTVIGTGQEDPEQWDGQVAASAGQLQRLVAEVLKLQVGVGIGRAVADLQDVPKAYQEAVEALKYRIRFEENSIIRFEDVVPAGNRKSRSFYSEQTAGQLLEAVRLGDRQRARELLKLFIQELLEEEVSYDEYQLSMLLLLLELIRELQRQGGTIRSIWTGESSLFETLLSLKTTAQFEEWFESRMIGPIIDLQESGRQARYRSISQQVKEIIRHDFATDLTLEVCAGRLNYHPNYIKQVFRKETGTNFSEYLAHYRLNVAKTWLVETDMKIVEIAEKLKYTNPQNFIRYFRKMEGVTPKQYREERKV